MTTGTAVEQQPDQRSRLWRFLQFPVIRALLAIVAIVGFAVAMQVGIKALQLPPHSWVGRALTLVLTAGVCLLYAGYVRLIEQRAVVELTLRDGPAGFGQGFVAGAALFAATVLVLWAIGDYTVTGVNGAGAMVGPLLGALGAAFLEEILLRGVVFRIVEESLGSWLALAFSALLFGLLHAFNRGATVTSTLAIALEAGILLAAVYMYSRRLWTCIGLHCAWNFTEGGVFGASVSGGTAKGLLSSRFQGADLLTGGAFGPEASVVAVLICLAASVAVIQLARRRGQIVQPFWRRA
jgi:membrane protease YdiL (CAAX protease family)